MDRELIIRLAREAELWEMLEGYSSEYVSGNTEEDCLPDLERFAALVVANNPPQSWMSYQEGYEAGQQAGRIAEREECAKVCEDEGERIDASWMSCAAAIRSRT